jgi:hypothetical protein
MTRLRLLALVALTLALVLGAQPVAAVTGWTGPTKVLRGHYYDVSTAVDTNGKTHAVAQGNTGSGMSRTGAAVGRGRA